LIRWDVVSGEQVSKLEGNYAEAISVAWNPVAKVQTMLVWNPVANQRSNQLVSDSADKTAVVWDATIGGKISELKGHTDCVRSVTWSYDEKQIATDSDDKTVLVWDAANGEQVLKLKGHMGYVSSVVWSPAGKKLATGLEDKTAVVCDAAKCEQVKVT
jgi:WD40 repeat protein